MANLAILAMMPLYLQRAHDFAPAETGIAFSAMILLGAMIQPLAGRISDRAGRRPVIAIGNAVAAFAALAVWLFGDLTVVAVAALAIAVMTLTSIRAALLAAAVDYVGRREATTLGLAFVLLDGVVLAAVLSIIASAGSLLPGFARARAAAT
jgi:MHS family proline/betaine transporter-like MFS transporter